MSVQVKICGLTSVEAADAAAKAGADFGGLVFHPKSPRRLGLEEAAFIAGRLRRRSRIVVVVAGANDEEIARIVAGVKPDLLQLHGGESPARTAAVRSRFRIAVIKAFAIGDETDFADVPAYEDVADMLLFDAKAPEAAARQGGHGAAFDWQLLRRRNFSRPWLLAGGLSAENVARAIRTSGAGGVDVSSGVETAPGTKSPDLIRAFVAAARNAQPATEHLM